MTSQDINVVLAHGAWADGSSWSKVITLLQTASVNVHAAPLPLTSLADDIASVSRTVERLRGPVILVGHAYAGAAISSARLDSVKSLVYIAGLAPDDGETVADVFYRADPHPLAPKLEPDEHDLIWLPQDAFATAFAQHASPEEQALLAAVQRPIALPCISTRVGRPRWNELPSWFLVAAEDRMIPADTQRFMAERMRARARSYPVDHSPMITSPRIVSDFILEAAWWRR